MRHIVFAVLAIALAGCASEKPFIPFPEAREVRLFGGVDFIEQSGDGKAKGMNGAPAADGGALSADEVALLRRSVRIGPEPEAIAMCCTPRHAFVFYDASHRAIGWLDVCFECGCAHLYPAPEALKSFSELNWDTQALTRIVEAHHLPPLPKKD